jgi:4-hydroxymandelate oxidase
MDPINLHDYEVLARERLPEMVYGYYMGGSGDELTLQENPRAWGLMRFRPRILVDVSERDLSTSVLGQTVSMPVLTAPSAFNAMAHPDGELAVARAAAAAGIISVVSTLSTYALEEIAEASEGPRWFQLYCYRDRRITRMLVDRAEAAGYAALCLTVDAPMFGQRERDIRNRFRLPPGMGMKNLEPVGLEQLSAAGGDESALQRYISEQLDPSLTWEVLEWLRGVTQLPLVVKGILTPEDALLAVERGVDGIIVSNHGGRQLDGALTTCEALPQVVDAVEGRVEVLVDGGIRRGADVLRALAMGARGILVGRPYLWGLAVGGEAGVRHVLEMLRGELSLAMALAGCPTIDSIDHTLLTLP